VKPHGALYNMSVRRDDIADAIAQATASFDTALVLVVCRGRRSFLPARAPACARPRKHLRSLRTNQTDR
jgi:lactam utilization protein B